MSVSGQRIKNRVGSVTAIRRSVMGLHSISVIIGAKIYGRALFRDSRRSVIAPCQSKDIAVGLRPLIVEGEMIIAILDFNLGMIWRSLSLISFVNRARYLFSPQAKLIADTSSWC